jgi:hypothetical protein
MGQRKKGFFIWQFKFEFHFASFAFCCQLLEHTLSPAVFMAITYKNDSQFSSKQMRLLYKFQQFNVPHLIADIFSLFSTKTYRLE